MRPERIEEADEVGLSRDRPRLEIGGEGRDGGPLENGDAVRLARAEVASDPSNRVFRERPSVEESHAPGRIDQDDEGPRGRPERRCERRVRGVEGEADVSIPARVRELTQGSPGGAEPDVEVACGGGSGLVDICVGEVQSTPDHGEIGVARDLDLAEGRRGLYAGMHAEI